MIKQIAARGEIPTVTVNTIFARLAAMRHEFLQLRTLESIYGKLSNQATTRWMEVLEWIIIVLITLSIVVSFFR